jgi:hypothetical protein
VRTRCGSVSVLMLLACRDIKIGGMTLAPQVELQSSAVEMRGRPLEVDLDFAHITCAGTADPSGLELVAAGTHTGLLMESKGSLKPSTDIISRRTIEFLDEKGFKVLTLVCSTSRDSYTTMFCVGAHPEKLLTGTDCADNIILFRPDGTVALASIKNQKYFHVVGSTLAPIKSLSMRISIRAEKDDVFAPVAFKGIQVRRLANLPATLTDENP